MSNRLSYASSPESDNEMLPGGIYDEDDQPSPIPRRKLIRSSSDPSINTGDNVPGIPPYPAPPSYHRDKQVFTYNEDFSRTELLLFTFKVHLHCAKAKLTFFPKGSKEIKYVIHI